MLLDKGVPFASFSPSEGRDIFEWMDRQLAEKQAALRDFEPSYVRMSPFEVRGTEQECEEQETDNLHGPGILRVFIMES